MPAILTQVKRIAGMARSYKETGLIQYSPTPGIGVALLTETFVTFLALLVLEIVRRTWRG